MALWRISRIRRSSTGMLESSMKYFLIPLSLFACSAFACPGSGSKEAAASAAVPVSLAKQAATSKDTRTAQRQASQTPVPATSVKPVADLRKAPGTL
jgi:hypothetical protein